jgi:hypothetical protein
VFAFLTGGHYVGVFAAVIDYYVAVAIVILGWGVASDVECMEFFITLQEATSGIFTYIRTRTAE